MVASNKRSRAFRWARAESADSCPVHHQRALAAEPRPRSRPGLGTSRPLPSPRGFCSRCHRDTAHVGLTISTDKPSRRRPTPRERPSRRHSECSASEEPGSHNQILFGQPDDEPKGPSACPAPRHPQSRGAACNARERQQQVLLLRRGPGCSTEAARCAGPVPAAGRRSLRGCLGERPRERMRAFATPLPDKGGY